MSIAGPFSAPSTSLLVMVLAARTILSTMPENAAAAADPGYASRKEVPASQAARTFGSMGMLPRYGTPKARAMPAGVLEPGSRGAKTFVRMLRLSSSGHAFWILWANVCKSE